MQEHAKYLLLDGIGCALVGAQLPASGRGVDGLTALDGGGRAALIGWGGQSASPQTAALLNSSFIQAFELDDYHPTAPLHSNSIVLPAMFAAASQTGPVHGRQLLLGAILAPERIYAGLGSVWETDRIAVKAYSAMGLLHAAIDAALQLRDQVAVDQIERIDVDMPGAAYEQVARGRSARSSRSARR